MESKQLLLAAFHKESDRSLQTSKRANFGKQNVTAEARSSSLHSQISTYASYVIHDHVTG